MSAVTDTEAKVPPFQRPADWMQTSPRRQADIPCEPSTRSSDISGRANIDTRARQIDHMASHGAQYQITTNHQ